MAFITLTPDSLTRRDITNKQEQMGFNTDNIVDLKPSNDGGTIIHTISGIRTVEETFDEVMAKCSE